MTTTNNTMNTEKMSIRFPLRATFLNGDSWEMLLDVTALDAEYVAPVLNGLLDDEVSEAYDIPLVREKIQRVHDVCVKQLVDWCMDYGVYDHCYTIDLILTAMEMGWCCEHCCIEEIQLLERLYQDMERGDYRARKRIEASLTEFFGKVRPFVLTFA